MAKVESVEQATSPDSELEFSMRSLGEKRLCPCGQVRFYDLNTRSKKPKCPQCGEVYIRDDDPKANLKTKTELDADRGATDDDVSQDYRSEEAEDSVKDEEDTDIDDETDEDADVDVIKATDEVELKIEDDEEEEGGVKPRKNYADVAMGEELEEDIMDDDKDDDDDIELDGDTVST